MGNQELHPKESLAIIQEMIQAEKMSFSENGFIYLFWGWLVIFAALAQFVLLQVELYSYHYYPWFLMLFGSVFTGFYYRKQNKRTKLPVSGSTLSYIWIAITVNIFGVAFFLPVQAGDFLLFIILSNIAVGTIVAGSLLKLKSLLLGGVVCIICAFTSVFLPQEYWNLLTIVAIVFSNIIPGYIFKKSYSTYSLA